MSTRALSGELIKNGLQCHGYHPFLLRHTFLRLELPSLSLNNIDLLINYQNVMYLNVADNSINDLSVLSHFPSLLQLKAWYAAAFMFNQTVNILLYVPVTTN